MGVFYFVVLVVVWVVATAMIMKNWEEDLGDLEAPDWLMGVSLGFCLALVWPLSVLAGGVVVAAKGLLKKMTKTKEEE